MIVAVVVVAAIVVLAVLLLSNPFQSSGSSVGAGTPVPYSQAVPVAIAKGQGAPGGPWTIVAATGIGVASGISDSSPASFSGSGCTFSTPSGGSTVTTVLGTPSNATPGEVSSWVFFAKNASSNAILLLDVSDGQASLWALVSGCSGVSTFTGMSGISASGVVDSTTVAAAFNAAGGSAFLSNHTSVTHFFFLLVASSATEGTSFWEVSYTTCALTATGGSGSSLIGVYNAVSGSLFDGPTATQETC